MVLASGWIFGWYANLSIIVLVIMTLVILVVCVFLDTLNLLDEVKTINDLLEKEHISDI